METSNAKLIGFGAAAFVALILVIAFFPLTIIDAGERGIVLRLGKVTDVFEPGAHLINPFLEDVETMDVRTQKEEVKADSASKDLQSVTTVVALNYHLKPESVGLLWQNTGKDYKGRIIDPAIQEAVKAATAKYTAEELITKREAVRDEIKKILSERLTREFVEVSEVSIVNFDFSAEFNRAIEAKVTAEQRALEAKNKLEQIKFEAEQKIATAEAEARSIRLQSDAANNEKYVSLKKLDVQLEFAKRWNGVLPVNLYGSAPIPFLQIGN